MEWSAAQVQWLVKVLQPERTVASLPGGWAGLDEGTRASLLGLSVEAYSAQHARLVSCSRTRPCARWSIDCR